MGKFDISTLSQLSVPITLVNFVLALLLSLLVQYCYNHFGRGVVNRRHLSTVFPLMTMTTFLVIVVVKSSLALSLGLVGALSIVRFRTPIKDPETLVFFFLAIAVGLGLGAEQRIITVMLVCLAVLFYIGLGLFNRKKENSNLYLNLFLPKNESASSAPLEEVKQLLIGFTKTLNLRRYDQNKDGYQITYLVDLNSPKELDTLTSKINTSFPGADITFVDNNSLNLG